ncbi:hypothetical protein COK67_30105 [Bacillus cereus]|uniref:hypothetical protein n=1 Tax=Bacillus cereus TaxID=1396 RepID=UPI000BF4C906|nr:hypothetical protein [Bacillus cereus]PFT53830.1 hypothetical protein COK67_30105 [Bacillus cereus]
MGALTGYAISIRDEDCGGGSSGPSVPGPDFDHTYVLSEAGDRWGCYGRDDCGSEIVTGGGGHRVRPARCLAEPNGTAAIAYGGTGVCHQCSNRILYPARKFVSDARGYAASVTAYGAYGLDYQVFMTNVVRCRANVDEELIAQSLSEKEKYFNDVLSLYSRGEKDIYKVIPEDLELLIRYRCQNRISQSEIIQIKDSHVEFLKEHHQLISAMNNEEITRREFIVKTISKLEERLYLFEKIIGEKEFLVVYGSPPDRASKILTVPNA